MKSILQNIAFLCMIAAISEQLMQDKRYYPSVRMVLGIRIVLVLVSGVEQVWQKING